MQKITKILLIFSKLILLINLLYVYSNLKDSIIIFNDMNSYYLSCNRDFFFYGILLVFLFTNILFIIFKNYNLNRKVYYLTYIIISDILLSVEVS